MAMGRRIASRCWVLAVLVVTACSGTTPEQEDDPGVTVSVCEDSDGVEDCRTGEPINPGQWDEPCDYEFCVPECAEVVIAPAADIPCHTALANPCDDQSDEGGFFYRLEDPEVRVDLGFDHALGSDTSPEGFRAHFAFLRVDAAVGEAPPDGLSFWVFHRFEAADKAVQHLQFDSGRLRGRLEVEVEEATYDLHGIDPDCQIDDMILECSCLFTGFELPLAVELDLPLVVPGS